MHTTTTVGLDIAKSVFQVHGIDADGNVVVRRQLGLGQIPLYAVAQHDATPKERLRGAFKLYALQRTSQRVNHQSTYDAP